MTPGRAPAATEKTGSHWRAVTISREVGSGAHGVGEALVEQLQRRRYADLDRPWTLFDKNLVEKVLEDHKLPARLAKFMTEDRISGIEDTLDELFGLHPPSWELVRSTAETILRLIELGGVVIIGRGGNAVTHHRKDVFHVRLVGSPEKRAEYIHQFRQVGKLQARKIVQIEDEARRRYLKKYFNQNIDDPLLYHLVINTDFVEYEKAGRLIADAMCPAEIAAAAG